MLHGIHLVLASRSVRRGQLLREAGLDFVQMDPPFDDPPQPAGHAAVADPARLAVELAAAKARSAAEVLAATAAIGAAGSARTLVIGADTIVISDAGELLGQPADRADARRMLEAIIGRTHQVVTGVALVLPAPAGARAEDTTRASASPAGGPVVRESFADTATVRIGQVGPALLRSYLDGGHWRGKAGAYNLAELEGSWPFEVRGDPTTVVGLPMRKLLETLRVVVRGL